MIAPVQPSSVTVKCLSNAQLRVTLQPRRQERSFSAMSSPRQGTAARIAQEMLQKLLHWRPAGIALMWPGPTP